MSEKISNYKAYPDILRYAPMIPSAHQGLTSILQCSEITVGTLTLNLDFEFILNLSGLYFKF